jgi:hypothetical protein
MASVQPREASTIPLEIPQSTIRTEFRNSLFLQHSAVSISWTVLTCESVSATVPSVLIT